MFKKAKKSIAILCVIGVFSVFSSFAATTNVHANNYYSVAVENDPGHTAESEVNIRGNYGYNEFRVKFTGGTGVAIGSLYQVGNPSPLYSFIVNRFDPEDYTYYWLEGRKSYYVKATGENASCKATIERLQ